MLEIKTNGNNLNLPKDITFNLVIENPFFLQDRIPSPHSLDFKLPGTPENKHRLGNPDRLASINSFGEYPAEVLFNTLKFASGKLVVDEFEKLIESHFRGSAFSEVVRQKLFAPEMEKYDFDFSSGMAALFTTPGNWAYAYRQLMIAATTAPDKFAVAPIRIKGAEWPYEESSWGNYATSTMYLSKYNVNNGSFYFPDGIGTHGTMFPMPFVSYLLEFLFGDALTANPFNTGELTNLVLPTVYHPAYNANYTVGAHQGVLLDGDKYFYLNSYLPDLASNEWLKDLLKTFCFTMFPNGNSFEIIHNKDIIEDNDVIDWDSKLVGDLTKTKEAGQSYGYGYSDNKAQTTGYTVNTIADLMGLALSEDAEYLIETTGQVIKKKLVAKENEEDPQEYEYEIVSPGFGGADGDYSMKPSLTPLSNKPDKYWWENAVPQKEWWYVPEWDGSRDARESKSYLSFWRGMKPVLTGSGTYPFMSPYNYDHNGNRIGDISLAWDGADGLINKFHSEFKAWIERDKLAVSGNFRLTELDLKNLNIKKKRHIRGKLFYIKKVEESIKLKKMGLALVSLVEA